MSNEHVEVLRNLSEVCRAAIKAGDWKVDGACDPDAVLRRADSAIAALSAPQPPAEAQRCTCPIGDGSLRWPCPAHPPEAQVQGGGEVFGWVLGDAFVDARFWTAGTPPQGWTPVYRTATPSAPVGVVGHVKALRELRDTGDVSDWRLFESALDAAIAALAQHPAATLPDVDDDDLTVAYMAGRHDGRKEAQQPAAAPVGVEGLHARADEIERAIVTDGMGAMAVYTQMRQLLPSRVAQQPAAIPRLANCGQYMALDNTGQYYYLNHANTWQTFQGQQPAAMDGAMVERIAALLHEEATDEPWAVAGVEHDGPDRDYYRTLARKVIDRAGQQPAAVDGAMVERILAEMREEGQADIVDGGVVLEWEDDLRNALAQQPTPVAPAAVDIGQFRTAVATHQLACRKTVRDCREGKLPSGNIQIYLGELAEANRLLDLVDSAAQQGGES